MAKDETPKPKRIIYLGTKLQAEWMLEAAEYFEHDCEYLSVDTMAFWGKIRRMCVEILEEKN